MHIKNSSGNPRQGYNHASNQKGWTNSSYRPSRNLEEAGYLGDEEYHDRLGIHNPLWRHIIKRYTTESEAPLIVIGFDTLPLAIELSQWTYPVHMVVREDQMKRTESDAQRQAGTFKSLVSHIERCPRSRVAIFIGIMDDMTDDEARKYIEYLLKGVREVVCAVREDRDWKKVLGKRIQYGLRYYHDQWRLLVLN